MINTKTVVLVSAALFLGLCAGLSVSAESLDSLFARIDDNYIESRFDENEKLLEEAKTKVSGSTERAEYLWRLSRNVLNLTDDLRREGADTDLLLERYSEGERYADEAVSLDSNNHNAYYWRGSNVGRWGQTKGILNSLVKAGPMKDDLVKAVNIEPEHADSYYVLGILYASVPKMISFGNVDYAVSYSRKAIDAYDGDKTKYSYYLKLATHLKDRGWNERKRERNIRGMADDYRKADEPAEKNQYYEGVFDFSDSQMYSRRGVENMSDEEEAKLIVDWLIDELEAKSNLTSGEKENLKDAKELRSAL